MSRYTKDFPLETWVIGRGDAERGYAQMLERRKMRSVGVGYYQREALADFSRQTMHMPPPPMPVQRQHSSHHPPSHPQVPVPQQHVSQPQPVLHGGMPYGPPQPQQVYFPGNQGLIDVGLDEQGRRIFRLAEPGEVQSMPAAPPTHAPSDTRAREQRAPSQPKAPMQAPSRSKPPKPRTQMDAAGAQVQVPVQTVT